MVMNNPYTQLTPFGQLTAEAKQRAFKNQLVQQEAQRKMQADLSGSNLPAAIQEYKFMQNLPSQAEKDMFVGMKGRSNIIDMGSHFAIFNRVTNTWQHVPKRPDGTMGQLPAAQPQYQAPTVQPTLSQGVAQPQYQAPMEQMPMDDGSLDDMFAYDDSGQFAETAPLGVTDNLTGVSVPMQAPMSVATKGLEPSQQPVVQEQQAAAKERGAFMQKGFQSLPLQQRALQDLELATQNTLRIAGDVGAIANQAFTTGFTGSIMDAVPGTPAHDLKMNLQTLEATAAFTTLQNMRNNSPTGGALGQVSERELDLLKASYAQLANSQTKEQFFRNLEAFNKRQVQALINVRKAYEQDYNRFGGQRDPNLPAPGAYTLPEFDLPPSPYAPANTYEGAKQRFDAMKGVVDFNDLPRGR